MTPLQLQFQYVGIPKRFFAFIIDYLVKLVFLSVLFSQSKAAPVGPKTLLYPVLVIALSLAYSALMESSTARGTLGKMTLGIEIIDRNGRQISLKQASLRYLGKDLWLLILFAVGVISFSGFVSGGSSRYLGFLIVGVIVAIAMWLLSYLMAAFTPEKQALHDRIAGTYVVEAGERSRSIPQKVIFQIVAIAIISRILLQVVPATFSLSDRSTAPTAQGEPPIASTEPPQEANTIGEWKTLTLLRQCGETEKLLPPDKREYLPYSVWNINFMNFRGETHEAKLQMDGENGVMVIEYYDDKTRSKKTVKEDMKLRISSQHKWLLGSNPINVVTQKPEITYSVDNLSYEKSTKGEKHIYNCKEDGKHLVSATPVPDK